MLARLLVLFSIRHLAHVLLFGLLAFRLLVHVLLFAVFCLHLLVCLKLLVLLDLLDVLLSETLLLRFSVQGLVAWDGGLLSLDKLLVSSEHFLVVDLLELEVHNPRLLALVYNTLRPIVRVGVRKVGNQLLVLLSYGLSRLNRVFGIAGLLYGGSFPHTARRKWWDLRGGSEQYLGL